MIALAPPRARVVSAMGASTLYSARERTARQPLCRRSRPLCVATQPEVLSGAELDAAIKAQGETVRGLKQAQAPKSEIDAAVARLLELKAMAAPSGPMELPTNENSPHLLRVRHTSAHILAMATQKLFPQAQVTIGPWIDNGFYYDFDAPEQFTPADLKKIQKEMQKIVRRNLPLRREEVSREEARARIEKLNEPYKLELLDAIKTEPITIYHIGDEWWDLCAGPHVESTGAIDAKAISIDSVAGAYWRGDEKRAMLQRIYGTAWESKEQLDEYQRRMEEAKRRDHRVLGKKLGLFSIQQEAGGGLVFWHPKGARIRRIIEDFWKEQHVANGYELLYTPHVANIDLWKTSGHFDFYKDGMFDQMDVEEEQYQIKPMNCPFHVLVRRAVLRPRALRDATCARARPPRSVLAGRQRAEGMGVGEWGWGAYGSAVLRASRSSRSPSDSASRARTARCTRMACALTASCPCAGPSWAPSTVTSARALCTGLCACAGSRKTTPISSVCRSSCPTRSSACST